MPRALVWVLPLVVLVRCQEQEHFLDLRSIVKGTIEAMSKLPEAAIQANASSTAKPDDLMSLFKLPADIMTNLAVGAGYLEEPQTSTYGPWIVAREKKTSAEEDSGSWEEVKKRKKKRPEDDGLVNLKDLLRLPAAPSLFGQADPKASQQDPLYRKEVSSDGQVHFVPVYPPAAPLSPTPSPFMVATPLVPTLPKRIQQSNQRFEAQTFPPAINPFQNQIALPPRIIQVPQPVLVPAPVPAPLPTSPLRQMQQVLPAAEEQQDQHPPVLVHPVMRNVETVKKPLEVQSRMAHNEDLNSPSQEASSSSEDESVVHSEESEVLPPVGKSVVSQTALRVRTVGHDGSQRRAFKEERASQRKKSHPTKKRVKVAPMDDEVATEPPTATRPSPLFEETMADIERPKINRRRRVHASKTLKIGRHEEMVGDTGERMSAELEQLPSRGFDSEQEEEQSIEVTTRPPRRRSRLWKKQTIRPKSKFTTTTERPTTIPEEETATEKLRRKKKRRNTKKKKNLKKYKRRRTTVALPTTTPAAFELTAQHCANIRSFARQFGFFDLKNFARKHCDFVENYYSELTCDRVEEYAEECQRLRRN